MIVVVDHVLLLIYDQLFIHISGCNMNILCVFCAGSADVM